MKFFLTILSAATFMWVSNIAAPHNARAQEALPDLPAPIQNLVDEGAQIRYLGREHGFDGWLTIKNGQEQYFYVPPGGDAFVMGVMFDKDGKLVTIEQVSKLRGQGDKTLDSLTDDGFGERLNPNNVQGSETDQFDFKSPSEQLFADIEKSNWVPLGRADAPAVYSFIDPQCPHCHSFINDLRGTYMDNGALQLRMIPVGFRDETRAQAAYLMATPNPQKRWFEHMDGDENALPAKSEINQQGVQRNLAIMQSWKFNVTPMIIYRGGDGSVKLVRGRPKNIPDIVADLNKGG